MTLRSKLSLFSLIVSSAVWAESIPAIYPEYNASLKAQMPLEQGWSQPPRLARTRVWWWWLNGNTDKETITRDLEAMKANDIGGANVIDAGGDSQDGNKPLPHGPDFASPAWRELFRHAVAEADRLDLELGFNIQSGWNLGGPTVPIEESSKKVTFSKVVIDGGKTVDMKLATPPAIAGFYRDVAVLAVPIGGGEKMSVQVAASSSQRGQDGAKNPQSRSEGVFQIPRPVHRHRGLAPAGGGTRTSG